METGWAERAGGLTAAGSPCRSGAGVSDDDPREQLHLMWDNWIAWATADPDRQHALARLGVAEDITAESHRAVGEAYSGAPPLLFTLDDLIAHPT